MRTERSCQEKLWNHCPGDTCILTGWSPE